MWWPWSTAKEDEKTTYEYSQQAFGQRQIALQQAANSLSASRIGNTTHGYHNQAGGMFATNASTQYINTPSTIASAHATTAGTYTAPGTPSWMSPIDANEMAAINAYLEDNGITAEDLWTALETIKRIKEEGAGLDADMVDSNSA